MKKTFRGYSFIEVERKKNEWLRESYKRGNYWLIYRKEIKPCIFFGNIKLIITFC